MHRIRLTRTRTHSGPDRGPTTPAGPPRRSSLDALHERAARRAVRTAVATSPCEHLDASMSDVLLVLRERRQGDVLVRRGDEPSGWISHPDARMHFRVGPRLLLSPARDATVCGRSDAHTGDGCVVRLYTGDAPLVPGELCPLADPNLASHFTEVTGASGVWDEEIRMHLPAVLTQLKEAALSLLDGDGAASASGTLRTA